MTNPLQEHHTLPPFSRIEPAHVEPAIRQLIERNKQAIEDLLQQQNEYAWENLLQPIEQLEDELAQAWSPVSHLNSVCNTDAMREAYNACLPLLSEYGTWMGQHSQLCNAYQSIADSDTFSSLDTAQQKSIDNALRDFAWLASPCRQSKTDAMANCVNACRSWAANLARMCWMPPMPGRDRPAWKNCRAASHGAGQCATGRTAGGP